MFKGKRMLCRAALIVYSIALLSACAAPPTSVVQPLPTETATTNAQPQASPTINAQTTTPTIVPTSTDSLTEQAIEELAYLWPSPLPEGLQVQAEQSTVSETGFELVLLNPANAQDQVFIRGGTLAQRPPSGEPVTVRNQPGTTFTTGGGYVVYWEENGAPYAVSGFLLSPERAVAIAETLEMIDAAEWRERLNAAAGAMPSPSGNSGSTGNSQIVYVRYDLAQQRAELHRIGMDGSDDRIIATAPKGCDILGLAVAPRGMHIAYSVGGCTTPGLHLINADGTGDQTLLNELTQVGTQAFSPDGTRVAFTRYRESGTAPVPESAIAVIDIAGTEPLQVTPWNFFFGQPAWRSDEQLVYAQAAIGTPPATWTTYTIDVRSESTPNVIHKGLLLSISPDRTALLMGFETQQDSNIVQLALAPLNDNDLRMLGDQPGPVPHTAWALDGETVAVYDSNTRQVTLLDVPGGQRTTLQEVEPASALNVRLTWDIQDKRLVYSTGNDTEAALHVFDATQNADRVIATLDRPPTFLAVSAAAPASSVLPPLEQEQLRICVAAAHGPLQAGVLDTVREALMEHVAYTSSSS